MTRWRVLLVGALSGLLVLAHLYAPRQAPPPAWAQGVGILSRATCTQINAPVAGQTFCFEQSTNTLKFWTGAQWVTATATQTGVNNVKDFGAKCDGVTDDATALTAAWAAVPSTGGVVFIPGVCLSSVALSTTATGFVLSGIGEATSELRFTTAVATAVIINGNSSVIQNLSITGNSIAQRGVYYIGARDPLMQHVDVTGFVNDSIYLSAATQHVSFRDLKITAGTGALNSARAIRQTVGATSLNCDGCLFQTGGTFTTLTVTGATNASPVEITTSAPHGLATGAEVAVLGVLGNLGANGHWTIINTGASTFTLTGSAGSGAYTSGGTATSTTKYGADLEAYGDLTVLTGSIFDAGSPTAILTTSGKLTDVGSYYQGAIVITHSIEANNPVVIIQPRNFLPNAITFKGSGSRSNLTVIGLANNTSMLTGQPLGAATLSPPSIVANQNDYRPVDANSVPFHFYQVMRLNPDNGSRSITGLEAGVDGEALILLNATTATTNTVNLAHQSGSSVAANRFLSQTATDVLLGPGASRVVVYDATAAAWRIPDYQGFLPDGLITVTGGYTPQAQFGQARTNPGNIDIIGARSTGNAQVAAIQFVNTAINAAVERRLGILEVDRQNADNNGQFLFFTQTAGSLAVAFRIGSGTMINSTVDQGAGTINVASAVYLNAIPALVASGASPNLTNIRAISTGASLGNNLRGTCNFAAAATCQVTFTNNEPTAAYFVATSCSGTNPIGVGTKTAAGFLLSASVSNSNTCDWLLIR